VDLERRLREAPISRAPAGRDGDKQLTLPSIELAASQVGHVPERSRRVFCNRNIRLDQIEWVGFDMDYTLAVYDQPKMDRLTILAALPKLIPRGYPESLCDIDYVLDFPMRGLVVDRKLGNVLKMDCHKYVKRAYHGLSELSYDERRASYHGTRIRAKGTSRFHFIDTLYALSEVTLFACGVAHMESLGLSVDYTKWFSDIRESVDISHQDGSILNAIMQSPDEFVVRDPDLPLALHKLRSAGKKLFLLTNSQPAYTDRMMRYLLEGRLPEYRSWRHMFDIVITAAKKPRFFVEENTPFLDEQEREVTRVTRGKMLLGGSAGELSRLGGLTGDRVLYVGDHIYGDVLRAKKHSPWRTAMIIQELGQELSGVDASMQAADRWDALEAARDALLDELRHAHAALRQAEPTPPEDTASQSERLRLRRRVERLRGRLRAVDSECAELERAIESCFHRYWGPLLKAGAEPSQFGDQVSAYACLYTAKVSNLLGYSPLHYFRCPRDRLPHEL
jgi:HAD superfamily 5'-nucleotidase-like hydrolase